MKKHSDNWDAEPEYRLECARKGYTRDSRMMLATWPWIPNSAESVPMPGQAHHLQDVRVAIKRYISLWTYVKEQMGAEDIDIGSWLHRYCLDAQVNLSQALPIPVISCLGNEFSKESGLEPGADMNSEEWWSYNYWLVNKGIINGRSGQFTSTWNLKNQYG